MELRAETNKGMTVSHHQQGVWDDTTLDVRGFPKKGESPRSFVLLIVGEGKHPHRSEIEIFMSVEGAILMRDALTAGIAAAQ